MDYQMLLLTSDMQVFRAENLYWKVCIVNSVTFQCLGNVEDKVDSNYYVFHLESSHFNRRVLEVTFHHIQILF